MNNPDFEINLNSSTIENQKNNFEIEQQPVEFTINLNGGARGLKGDKGDTGSQGIQGEKGDKGDKGDTGEAGKDGAVQYSAGTGIEITDDNVINNTQTSAEWGNISGDITDQEDLQDALDLKANQSTTYTKSEVDSLIPDVSDFITRTVNDLANYYLKSETYTQAEVNTLIGAISTLNILVVQALPTHDISTSTIYLVPKNPAEPSNYYDEYIYVSNAWEKIGDTQIDLSDYVTFTDLNTALANYTTTTDLTTLLNLKQDIIPQQDTAPSNPSEDDLWIDTDDNTNLVEIDSTVSTTSTNPIENQAITNYVDSKLADSGWTLIDNSIYYKKVGKQVTIMRQARGSGGAYIQNEIALTGFDYTNITSSVPAAIRPSTRLTFLVYVHFTDNSYGTSNCYGELQTYGKLSIYNWGNQKTANRLAFCVSYTVD